MSCVVVDSNVLLDLMTEDARWFAWSVAAVRAAANRFRLVINPIIYAEVSVRYARIEDVEEVLPRSMFDREPLTEEMSFLASKAFVIYRRKGGPPRSPLPDFFIGAHAAIAGYQLLTRDTARYRTYFPDIELIEPG